MTARPEAPLVIGMGWFGDQRGGLNRYVRDYLQAWTDSGSAATSIMIGPGTGAPPSVTTASTHGASILRRLTALARAGRRADTPSWVDAHFAMTAIPVLLANPRLRRRPLIVHFHGPWADETVENGGARPLAAALRVIERSLYRRADHVIAMSEAFAELLVERYGVDRSRVSVIHPGVDTDRFSDGDQVAARERLGLNPTGPLLVCVRRLVPRMGVDTLLASMVELPGVELLIVGDGPDAPRLERLSAELGIADRIRFVGGIDDEALVDAYRAGDVTVIPTHELEGFGLTALEGLACGRPVVATAVGGLVDAVGPDRDLLSPPRDPAALATSIRVALGRDPQHTAEARAAHLRSHSWSTVVDAHRDIVAGVLGRRPKVLALDHCAALSGGELALARVLPALASPTEVLLAEDGPLADRIRTAGGRVDIAPLPDLVRHAGRGIGDARSNVPAAKRRSLRTAWRLTMSIRSRQPDVIYANSLKACLYGGVLGRVLRVPVVWHVRDRVAVDYLSPTRTHAIRLAARLLPTEIVANSTTTADALHAGHKTTVIPSPIDRTSLLRASRSKTGNLDHTRPLHFAVVGRLAPWKGQDVFLEAFAKAFPTGGETATIVGGALFGEDAFADELLRRVDRLGLSDRIRFTGHVEDTHEYLARADVAVHPSRIEEPFGQVVAEALTAGIPVISTGGGAADLFLHDGRTGILVPPADCDALADAMRRARSDEALRRAAAVEGPPSTVMLEPGIVAAKLDAVFDAAWKGRSDA